MKKINSNFKNCYENSKLILTEGSIGLRLSNEFGIMPDNHIKYTSLIYDSDGRKALEILYRQYLQVAQDYSLPILLMSNTRRANKERVQNSIYKNKNVISDYACFLKELIQQYDCEAYIGGSMGCKGDGYTGEGKLTIEEAIDFHSWQVDAFAQSDIDFIFASIMPTLDETIGMAKAIEKSDYPYIISFMIRKNGKITDGHYIHDAIQAIDDNTGRKPLCYMTNCVHPKILLEALTMNNTDLVKSRFKGIQSNAACLSPEELECATNVITTDANILVDDLISLNKSFPMKIYGGCCGTDQTHIKEIAERMKVV